MAAAKIMFVAGESWTMSSEYWDVTNYAFFTGDTTAARQIGLWTLEAATKLGVQEVWMSECGHGYNALRWEAENWLGRPFPFRVRGLSNRWPNTFVRGASCWTRPRTRCR